jgi:hypothetical protein
MSDTITTPVILPEQTCPLEFAPKGSRLERVSTALFGRKAPPPPEPKPQTPLEAHQLFVRKARRPVPYFVSNPKMDARILAVVKIVEAEWPRLKERDQQLASIETQRRAHGPNRERQAKKEYHAKVAEAVAKNLPLPEPFTLEKVRSERDAVMAGVSMALRELQAEAYPLVLEIGCRILRACYTLADQAQGEEAKLAESWGVEVKASQIANAYRGVASYFATYLPDDPTTLRSISGALPLLAEQLKAK